jgi:ADP-heptose:LPS heptosyltransferase
MDSTGVYEMTPKQHDIFVFKESILVGEVEREDTIWSSLHKMMKKFRANEYDMLKQNCNHFSNEFLVLLLGRGLPRHLNRIAYVGSFLHCIVPKKYLIVTP